MRSGDFCGDLEGPVMVFGSPKGRSAAAGQSVVEAKKYLADGLAGVADHARQRLGDYLTILDVGCGGGLLAEALALALSPRVAPAVRERIGARHLKWTAAR